MSPYVDNTVSVAFNAMSFFVLNEMIIQ